jgi:GNAT superfamily N-acetyltransferase
MTDQAVRIEPARALDLVALTTIQALSFSEEVGLYGTGPPGYKSLEWQAQALRRAEYFKILADQLIVGGIVARQVSPGHYLLVRIFVHPDHQDRGVGTQAFRLIEARFPTAEKWSLNTPYRSFRNHHFYRKLGFTHTETMTPEGFDLSRDPEFCVFVFEKRRSAPV